MKFASKLNWLKNAFAVNAPTSPPTKEQLHLVDRLAHEVVRRQLTSPALTFLEMSRPLNFLGAQAMHFFSPMISSLFDAQGYEDFARFLERRDAIDVICQRIEQLEQIATTQDQQRRQARRESQQT